MSLPHDPKKMKFTTPEVTMLEDIDTDDSDTDDSYTDDSDTDDSDTDDGGGTTDTTFPYYIISELPKSFFKKIKCTDISPHSPHPPRKRKFKDKSADKYLIHAKYQLEIAKTITKTIKKIKLTEKLITETKTKTSPSCEDAADLKYYECELLKHEDNMQHLLIQKEKLDAKYYKQCNKNSEKQEAIDDKTNRSKTVTFVTKHYEHKTQVTTPCLCSQHSGVKDKSKMCMSEFNSTITSFSDYNCKHAVVSNTHTHTHDTHLIKIPDDDTDYRTLQKTIETPGKLSLITCYEIKHHKDNEQTRAFLENYNKFHDADKGLSIRGDLFHVPRQCPDTFTNIADEGLKVEYSSENALLGPGNYTTSDILKASMYFRQSKTCKCKLHPGLVVFFICHLQIGNLYRLPVFKTLTKPPLDCDTVEANLSVGTEFVTYRNGQSLVVNIVLCKRNDIVPQQMPLSSTASQTLFVTSEVKTLLTKIIQTLGLGKDILTNKLIPELFNSNISTVCFLAVIESRTQSPAIGALLRSQFVDAIEKQKTELKKYNIALTSSSMLSVPIPIPTQVSVLPTSMQTPPPPISISLLMSIPTPVHTSSTVLHDSIGTILEKHNIGGHKTEFDVIITKVLNLSCNLNQFVDFIKSKISTQIDKVLYENIIEELSDTVAEYMIDFIVNKIT